MARAKIGVEFDPVVTRKVDRELARLQAQAKGIDFGGGARSLNKLSRPLGKITGQANEFQKSLEASNARVLAFGASVVVINKLSQAFSALVSNTVKVEATFAKINTILGGTQAQLKQFGDGIFQVAKNTATSFDEVAEGALELARQGLSVEASLGRVEVALKLVRVAGIDSQKAVAGLTAAIKGFESAGITVAQIGDKLAQVDTKFAVSTEDLINGLERASASARVAGVSFDELLAAVTTVQERTQRGGAVIGNAFKTIFARLGRTDTLQTLENLGISVLDAEGNVRDAIPLFRELAAELDALGIRSTQAGEIIQKVAGVRQRDILINLVEDLNSEFSKFDQAIGVAENSIGSLDQKNKQLNQTLDALIKNLVTSGQQLASTLGNIGFLDAAKGIVDGFTTVVNKIREVLDGEGIGSTFARGLVKGIGSILTGPGLGLALAIFTKLFVDLAKFGVQSLKSLLGINAATERQNALQQSVLQSLLQNEALQASLLKLGNDKAAQEQLLLRVYQQQVTAMQRLATISKNVTPGLYGRGFRGGPEGIGKASGGYIASERRDVNRGVGGATSAAKVVSIPNFAFGGGKRGTMIANTSEYIVPNYAGGGDAIFNQNMVKSMGLPPGARKITAAGGYVPNFVRLRPQIKLKDSGITTAEEARAAGYSEPQISSAFGAQGQRNKARAAAASKKQAGIFNANAAGIVMLVPQRGVSGQDISMSFQKPRKGRKGTYTGFVGSAYGISNNLQNNKRFQNISNLDDELENSMADSINNIVKKIYPSIKTTPTPPISPDVAKDKFLREGGAGAFGAFKGAMFEAIIEMITGGSRKDRAGTLDVKFGGGNRAALNTIFGLPTGVYNDGDYKSSILQKSKFATQAIKARGASGYIPNYFVGGDPLQSAILREQAAGVPINQIRVNQSGKLRNSGNPMGLAVTNTRDEPTGAIPTASQGYIPNYVAPALAILPMLMQAANIALIVSTVAPYVMNFMDKRMGGRKMQTPTGQTIRGLDGKPMRNPNKPMRPTGGLMGLMFTSMMINDMANQFGQDFGGGGGSSSNLLDGLTPNPKSRKERIKELEQRESIANLFGEPMVQRQRSKGRNIRGQSKGFETYSVVDPKFLADMKELNQLRAEEATQVEKTTQKTSELQKQRAFVAKKESTGLGVDVRAGDIGFSGTGTLAERAQVNPAIASAFATGVFGDMRRSQMSGTESQRIKELKVELGIAKNLTEEQRVQKEFDISSLELTRESNIARINLLETITQEAIKGKDIGRIKTKELKTLMKSVDINTDARDLADEIAKITGITEDEAKKLADKAITRTAELKDQEETSKQELINQKDINAAIARGNDLFNQRIRIQDLGFANRGLGVDISQSQEDLRQIGGLNLVGADKRAFDVQTIKNQATIDLTSLQIEKDIKATDINRQLQLTSDTEEIKALNEQLDLIEKKYKIDQERIEALRDFNAEQTGMSPLQRYADQKRKEVEIFTDELPARMAANFEQGMNSALDGLADGTYDTLGEALGNVAIQFGNDLLQELRRVAMADFMKAITGDDGVGGSSILSGIGGFIKDLFTKKKNSGGMITGGSGVVDDVPALLTGGEYVIKKSAVQKYGQGFLNSLNAGVLPGFNNGGPVTHEAQRVAADGSLQGGDNIRTTEFFMYQGEGLFGRDHDRKADLSQMFGGAASNERLERARGMDFFMPGDRGAGGIIGKENLLAFSQQMMTSGTTDEVSQGRINLELQSARLSPLGRHLARQSPAGQRLVEAQGQAYNLAMQSAAEEQRVVDENQQARTARREALQSAIKSAAINAVVTAGVQAAAQGLQNMQMSNQAANAGATNVGGYEAAPQSVKLQLDAGAKNVMSGDTMYFKDYNPVFGSSNVKPAKTTSIFNYGSKEALGGIMGGTSTGLLTGGEYVVNSEATDAIGKETLDSVNQMTYALGGPVGSVGTGKSSSPSAKSDVENVNITINIEKDGSTDATASTEGGQDPEKAKEFSKKVKDVVLNVINEEKRVSGSLFTRTK